MARGDSDWVPGAQYQQYFNDQLKQGLYPIRVEGRVRNGVEEFRAEWRPAPTAAWESRHLLTRQEYEQKNRDLTEEGYITESTTTSRDSSGVARYPATWRRTQ